MKPLLVKLIAILLFLCQFFPIRVAFALAHTILIIGEIVYSACICKIKRKALRMLVNATFFGLHFGRGRGDRSLDLRFWRPSKGFIIIPPVNIKSINLHPFTYVPVIFQSQIILLRPYIEKPDVIVTVWGGKPSGAAS